MHEDGYEAVVLQHRDGVHGYARQVLRDREEAADIAQEALIRLWQHRKKVDVASARAWLMRTAHNLCIDRIRRRRTRAEVDDGATVIEMRPTSDAGPDRLAASSDLGRRIQHALGRLGEVDRSVIWMREVQGLPYGEIAEILGQPLGTVKARLHRARERLRKELQRRGATPNAL